MHDSVQTCITSEPFARSADLPASMLLSWRHLTLSTAAVLSLTGGPKCMQRALVRPTAFAATARTGMCSTAPIIQRRSPSAAAAAWRRSCRCCLATPSHPSSCKRAQLSMFPLPCTCSYAAKGLLVLLRRHICTQALRRFPCMFTCAVHPYGNVPDGSNHIGVCCTDARAPTEVHTMQMQNTRYTMLSAVCSLPILAAGCVPAAGGRVRRQVLLHRGASGHPSHAGGSHPVIFSLQVQLAMQSGCVQWGIL